MSEYFRGDEKSGITAPNLANICCYVDHIVKARGRKTQYTSVSLAPNSIQIFGEVMYRLLRTQAESDGHDVVEHHNLITDIQNTIKKSVKADKIKAARALQYAQKRKEGLVVWNFKLKNLKSKWIIRYAHIRIQKYFDKV
ncbi:hypothetical protein HLH26_11610 [Gluconacetobacter sp. 1b LMG 1731]|uniref:Uncharacterized protein n=1 Tax=Gluconacetobacter dulcium TaxID=2729096 RepID=A0A7W4ILN2_9PROT|nr:hypothetical protein [Gluconacetobacter dulcium]MBB2165170.1 hypothetical protein [Gluconacetobacter dulcium]MBB2194421.1 hypothetical protein [Gluconacetobacter dulcium]